MLLCCAVLLTPASGQPPPSVSAAVPVAAPPAFKRPLPADMGQRLLACSACHGQQGRATPGGYFPRIAGKPAGYLYQQLLHFQAGRRRYAPMAGLLEHLSDDYLQDIAQHFSALDLPYAAPLPAAPSPAALRGQRLVQEGDASGQIPACVRCHGAALTGVAPAIPGLLGLSRDYLSAQLGAWQTGQRQALAPDCMAHIAQRLTAPDIQAIALWLAQQPLPALAQPVQALPAALPMPCGSVPDLPAVPGAVGAP